MGGILSGSYKFATGAVGVLGGSSERAAADDTLDSKLQAAQVGELEAKQQGNFEAGRLRMMGSKLIAEQNTRYANSGVDTTAGTPLAVMADTRLMSEVDARMAENNAARRVRGFREQKRQAQSEWRTRVSTDQQNQVGSMLSGIGDIVGGAAGFK